MLTDASLDCAQRVAPGVSAGSRAGLEPHTARFLNLIWVISGLGHGGAETQILALAPEIARRGHKIALFCLTDHVPRMDALVDTGVHVERARKRWPYDPAVVRRLADFARAQDADLLHGFLYDGNFYARLAGRAARLPAINSERSSDYRMSLPQALGHLCTRRLATAVIANSGAGARFAKTLFKLPAHDFHVVWNGVDAAALRTRALRQAVDVGALFSPPVDRVALLVANIKPEKDYRLALATAAELFARDARWGVLCVGEQLVDARSDCAKRVQQQWRRLKLEGRVVFTGRRDDVPGLMAASDVLFSTSVREGFPNGVLEAMAIGTPVVSTDYSDIREILPSAEQIVTNRDPAELALAILNAHARRDELIRSQQAWVLAHAGLTHAASKLEQVYANYV